MYHYNNDFKDAYIYLLRTFETDIKPHNIEKVLNFIKDNRLGGDDDYKLAAEYLENTIVDYLNEEINHYEVEEEFKKIFYENNFFKLISKQILRDADEFLNSYFNLRAEREVDLRKIINLKNDDEKFYIENQEEALENLEIMISDIDYEELNEEAENSYYKKEYICYFAFKFLTRLIYQKNLKKAI